MSLDSLFELHVDSYIKLINEMICIIVESLQNIIENDFVLILQITIYLTYLKLPRTGLITLLQHKMLL